MPDSFAEHVKDALEHLYDLAYLQRHLLVRDLASSGRRPAEIAAQSLRRELASAIEALNPGSGVSIHDLRARVYNLLVLHYLQDMTVREAARELSISERHAYRGLREGEQLVADVVWARRSAQVESPAREVRRTSLATEMERLSDSAKVADLAALLDSATSAVEPLAAQRSIQVRILADDGGPFIATNPPLAQQLLIALLSAAVEQARAGDLRVIVTGASCPGLVLRYRSDAAESGPSGLDHLVQQLARELEWAVDYASLAEDERAITVEIPDRRFSLLVVDDNEGLVELLERFVTHYPAQVTAAHDGVAGLRLAQEKTPDAIVLDVMMPGMHGWQVLQRLQNHPATSGIPVIVCSVITIPELADALGAVQFLPKPVGQEAFLDALRQLGLL
jgi:CheY-like chemotaxis protein